MTPLVLKRSLKLSERVVVWRVVDLRQEALVMVDSLHSFRTSSSHRPRRTLLKVKIHSVSSPSLQSATVQFQLRRNPIAYVPTKVAQKTPTIAQASELQLLQRHLVTSALTVLLKRSTPMISQSHSQRKTQLLKRTSPTRQLPQHQPLTNFRSASSQAVAPNLLLPKHSVANLCKEMSLQSQSPQK